LSGITIPDFTDWFQGLDFLYTHEHVVLPGRIVVLTSPVGKPVDTDWSSIDLDITEGISWDRIWFSSMHFLRMMHSKK